MDINSENAVMQERKRCVGILESLCPDQYDTSDPTDHDTHLVNWTLRNAIEKIINNNHE